MIRRLLRWIASALGVLLLVVALVLTGFRIAADRRETLSRFDNAPKTGRFFRAADVYMFVQ